MRPRAPDSSAVSSKEELAAQRQWLYRKSLTIADGNKTKASEMLGISRFTLQRKMEKYHLG